jgi:transposase
MRGADEQQGGVFSYINPEDRIPQDHPVRQIRAISDRCLKQMGAHFEALYSHRGRPSIPPERLLRALLLQALYSIRSERQLMEQLDYNLLFRWFVGLNPDDPIWDVTVFTKNRDRMMEGEVSQRLLAAVVAEAAQHHLLSEEHFTVDGTLIEAWASRKSFVPKDPPPTQGSGSRGRTVLRDKVESKTDPEARLYKKSTASEARPSYLGHSLIENRCGLVVAARATQSSTWAEREAALAMLDELGRRPDQVTAATAAITLGGDKLYQEEKFIAGLRARKVIPHIAEYRGDTEGRNALRDQERDHPGFATSQRKRKLVEKVFGWAKLDSIGRQVKVRGTRKVDWFFRLLATAANLVRMVKLIPAV